MKEEFATREAFLPALISAVLSLKNEVNKSKQMAKGSHQDIQRKFHRTDIEIELIERHIPTIEEELKKAKEELSNIVS
jgi:hypothetical protein